ncbi:MAG: bifunctional DNA-formamidopyrimidine glycosylase/DNA-(apurinic or apyrimidinic site) lyase [Gammaproteobacteria bacterium]
MPELPEVETCRQGIAPYVLHKIINDVSIYHYQLRWPISPLLPNCLIDTTFTELSRRGKYLLFKNHKGTLIIHLGMSGSLRLCSPQTPLKKHDHVVLQFAEGKELRYHDPRRFGALVWTEEPSQSHPLLVNLGLEPLSESFTVDNLLAKSQGKRKPIKNVIMDGNIVVGIGNIYANEILYVSKIHPLLPCCELKPKQWFILVEKCQRVLQQAIQQGGTTLRDFVNGHGEPGYFAQALHVYGRDGEPCHHCAQPIERIIMQGRSTFFCPSCQPLSLK